MDWRDRIVIVTGASSGIGAATARRFAERGATVVAVARREARLRDVIDDCRRHAPRSEYRAGDLGQRDFARAVVEETAARHGRMDVLVNNAAIPVRRILYETTVEEAEEALRINFLSCLWTSFAVIPAMLRGGGGTIVNVSSFASKVVPTHETLYATAKCAMNGFSEGLWNDLAGSDIHVALLHPGPIDTEIWDKGQVRSGYAGFKYPPEIVADAVLEMVEKRQFERVVPGRNPKLALARFLRLVFPSLLRLGVRRMDPVPADAVERARARAREGRRLGE